MITQSAIPRHGTRVTEYRSSLLHQFHCVKAGWRWTPQFDDLQAKNGTGLATANAKAGGGACGIGLGTLLNSTSRDLYSDSLLTDCLPASL